MLNSTNSYYDGVGNSSTSSGLPLQTIPKHRKTTKWEKECMDSLEEIGVKQVSENVEFRSYYKMTEGSVVYADYQPAPEVTRDIISLRNEIDLPSYIKHFDVLGIIINQVVGEYDNHQDKIRIDSLDEFAQNEYSRSKNKKLQTYIQESFDLEIKVKLAQTGFPIDKEDFESEEEQQQYMQALEQEKAKIVPPAEIQRQLNKDFKVRIVEWAEHVYEADRKKFSLALLEKQELKDYLLTGRYFRHYHVGYDTYKPEHWRVEETFFSQDLDIKYPQDGEYVGRVFRASPSDIIQRYGHLLTHDQQVAITKSFASTSSSSGNGETYDMTKDLKRPVKEVLEPLGYETLKMTEQLQDAFQSPLGEATYKDSDGNEKTVPYWMTGYDEGTGFLNNNVSIGLRDDINVRQDTYQVTEGYWRGWKLTGFLFYEDEKGIPDMAMVSEDLLSDFLAENNIKKLKSVALETFEKDPEINTIAYTYLPCIYKGKKIKGVSAGKEKDIYFDIDELEFQIKGDSNLYDKKLPVAGIIANSFAKKIMPYQFGHNVAMNQITNLLEKEIGMFFLMDINFLPSEFKDMGDSKSMLLELRDMAKEIGFMPVDTSKKNLEGGSNTNGFMQQNISYAAEVQYRLQLADKYKMLALEQIGITPQRVGTPTSGETAEGIRQGVTASYAQTDNIYAPFNEANRKAIELHLVVAQYAEKSEKDISVFYRKDEGDIATMVFDDDKFHLRQLGVIPLSDSKVRKNIEQLRNVLLNNNTMGSDMLEYAELFTADSMVELVSIGRRNRIEKQQQEQQVHQQEMELLEKDAALKESALKSEYDRIEASKSKDRATDIEEANIRAVGAAVDNNAEDSKLNYLLKVLDQGIKKDDLQVKNNIKTQEVAHKQDIDKKSISIQEQDMALRIKELRVKMEEIKSRERIANVNKN